MAGRVVTADTLHTQVETARSVVEDKRAHYLFTVKDNQSTRKADIADLQMEAFPPDHVPVDKTHGRVETRRIWTRDTLNDDVACPYTAQVACVEREISHVRRGPRPPSSGSI